MRKLLAASALSAMLAMGIVGTVSAHSGEIVATEGCGTFTVVVTLDHNVTEDRSVDVNSTLPGFVGYTDAHFDTTAGQIFEASGPAPETGTVTLTIRFHGQVEFTTSASVAPVPDCATPSPSNPASASPKPSHHTTTPRPTPPVTATIAQPSGTDSKGGESFLSFLIFVGGGLLVVQTAKRRRTR